MKGNQKERPSHDNQPQTDQLRESKKIMRPNRDFILLISRANEELTSPEFIQLANDLTNYLENDTLRPIQSGNPEKIEKLRQQFVLLMNQLRGQLSDSELSGLKGEIKNYLKLQKTLAARK